MTHHHEDILITTSEHVPDRPVLKVLGIVKGNSVRARHVGRDIQAAVRGIVGGRVGVFAELLNESREEALAIMIEQAHDMGANGVIAVRMTTSQVMSGAAEIVAYGTAVTLLEVTDE